MCARPDVAECFSRRMCDINQACISELEALGLGPNYSIAVAKTTIESTPGQQ
jgi:hypothetical protein